MKAQILKIAGVKSEKEFYKKFPTEESFMKIHGKSLKKAQIGAMIQGSASPQFNPQPINFQQLYDQNDMLITGSTQDERDQEALQLAQLAAQQKGAKNGKKLKKAFLGENTTPMGKSGMADVFGKVGKGISAGVDKAGGPMAVAQSVGDIVGGFQQMKGEKDLMKRTQQMAEVSGVGLQASMTRPEQEKRRYVRPDDPGNIVQPGQLYNPLGYGTNILAAKNGTEIANTFAPNTIYTDLEEAQDGSNLFKFKTNPDFLKLNSSGQQTDISKFAEQGGGDVLSQLTSSIGNPKGYGPSGASRVGGGVGKIAGTIFGGPVGGFIGEKVGQIGGDLVSKTAEDTEQARGVLDRNIMTMAFNQGTQGLQQQNYAYMRDGGMANPQVATSLEGIPLTRLFAPDPTMDTLRAGGHLKSYTPPSERAMYTGRDKFAMGGDLETHWGGYAEPISYNHHLPKGGETVMFRGQSHEESDGKGRTGIGITYGDAPVEVEKLEPAVELENGSSGDTSLTVYGNLVIPKFGAEMIGNSKAAGKKFKNYVADLSKKEQKQNKIIEKSVDELDSLDVNNPYDLLKFRSYESNMLGANQNLKDIADEKIKLANLQSAINDTAEEYGFEADALAKGKVKQAQKGMRIRGNSVSYQPGLANYLTSQLNQTPLMGPVKRGSTTSDTVKENSSNSKKSPDVVREEIKPINIPTSVDMTALRDAVRKRAIGEIKLPENLKEDSKKALRELKPLFPKTNEEDGEFDWMTIANQVLPYLRPTDAEALDPRQLAGEIFALATNQVEPVQAQTFQPQLATPYDISLQDIINKNQADYRAAQRMIGYNPAALSFLNAQMYDANQQVLGEQFRLNQAMRDKVYAENRNLLNQTGLQNLAIFDQQYGRQQEALSKTKATTQAALNSISAKYLQNQAENRELQTYENLYNYRFDPRFRAMNMNPLAQFNTALGNFSADQIEEILKLKREEEAKKNKTTVAKNGSLVKAIKSM